MAFKVSSERLIDVTKLLDRADKAINTLERGGGNKIVYLELKKSIQDMSTTLKKAYDLENFEEWKTR